MTMPACLLLHDYPMQKEFVRSIDSLKEIYDFTETCFGMDQVSDQSRYAVHFAIEELFTNMVKYNAGNMNCILLDVSTDAGTVTVTITDYDVDKFDVSKKRRVDTESPVAERPVGGLGLHLIRHMVDTLDYRYADRESRITFTKGSAGA